MGLIETLVPLQTPLLLIAVVFGPSLLPRLLAILTRRPAKVSTPRPPFPTTLKLALALHALYHLYRLILPPYDIFVTHSLSILTPNEALRSVILRSSTSSNP
ncbi:hypothetical protein P7C73_g4835, partial [Tremellales sp. Uapishka_1]